METEQKPTELKVDHNDITREIHESFQRVLGFIAGEVDQIFKKYPGLDQGDSNRWAVAARIFNRAYLHFWTPIFTGVAKKVLDDNDLFGPEKKP